jgi:hypothetical protein
MHNPKDGRVLGYDNAHLPGNLRHTTKHASPVALDHRHWREAEATPYLFTTPEALLADFWDDAYRLLKEEGIL